MEKDNNSDLDMYIQFSEGKGYVWPDLDEERGQQSSHPFFSYTLSVIFAAT